ncbi:MAG: hypothetical protein NZV14_01475 [Bryobacteraceae bacterium]|nr:hypothetical protein [Bryobacteraceae bacterium]MDW8376800.1 hypothetical protein [Bryobacterales bacterium]
MLLGQLALWAYLITSSLSGQETLNNESIIKLVKSGLGEDLILNVIRQQPGNYKMGADDLVALKSAGVSERIISAMLARGREASPASPEAAAPATASRTSINRPGIYYKKGNEFFELISEEVEWAEKGAVKSFVSAGIIKKDLKGTLAGPGSRNFLTHPIEVIFSLDAGQSINNFLLLPMRVNKGQRSFVVGPVNQKSGVAKGAIAFGVEKLADNQFRMVLQTPLAPGEYGILLTSDVGSSTGTSKIFTFRVRL